jgi:hypothetical protein
VTSAEAGPFARLNAALDALHPSARYVRVEAIDLAAGLVEARLVDVARLTEAIIRADELNAEGLPPKETQGPPPEWYRGYAAIVAAEYRRLTDKAVP